MGIDEPTLFGEPAVEFIIAPAADSSHAVAVPTMETENALQRVANSQTQRFGSIVAADDATKPKGVRVRQILAPNRLRLSDGNEVQLLGIEPLETKENEALNYLEKMVLGNSVFLKFDCEAEKRAYVYLANKTFVNAKSIKQGLCKVDRQIEHRHLKRFCAYEQELNYV